MSQSGEDLNRTPLHAVHVALGARMIPFGGWEMPVEYGSLLSEHRAVRRAAGLFDLSHMGELFVSGPAAAANLQFLLTNDVSALRPGKAQYTFLCNERGGIVDDLIVYCLDQERYMLVTNAANRGKALTWLRDRLQGDVELADRTEETALLAVQGPRASQVVAEALGQAVEALSPFGFVEMNLDGDSVLVSRTGYTGEDGFELYVPWSGAERWWERLLNAGEPAAMVPVGLGARDTLRLEARFPLYGNELTEERTPIEAGLAFAVKLDKGDFVGRDALLAQRESGAAERLIGFEMVERGIPRHGYPLFSGDERVGEVTSGSFSPTLEKNIGMGYVSAEHAQGERPLAVEIRGKRVKAKLVQGRFV